ncbi:MAG: hypothetical protein GC154_12010 [bacterium]|nr:hypothetical protein [bacterium]
MPRRTIHLSDPQDQFIDRMIQDGVYRDASELVQIALYRFQNEHESDDVDQAACLRAIGENALESVQRGEGKDITDPNERGKVFDEIKERARIRAEKIIQENS